jgi:uridine kinase
MSMAVEYGFCVVAEWCSSTYEIASPGSRVYRSVMASQRRAHEDDENSVLVVGIAGGTGSGKSTLARRLAWAIGEERCAVLTQDNYYRDLSELSFEARTRVNFDHPDAIDDGLLAEQLAQLRSGQDVQVPQYDFGQHVRGNKSICVSSRPVVLVEGILIFQWPAVLDLLDVKIFVDADDDVRLMRRVRRDIADRGRDVDSVLNQYQATVKPMHSRFVEPARRLADLIVTGHGDNQVVVDILAKAFLPS